MSGAERLTAIGRERLVFGDSGYVIQSKRGRDWAREMTAPTLDAAIETMGRRYVERRFRSGHARIPLDEKTALTFAKERWTLETALKHSGVTHRGSWPNIFAALSGGRSGAKHAGLELVRRALHEAHVAAVHELRDGLLDSDDDPRRQELVNMAVLHAANEGQATSGSPGADRALKQHQNGSQRGPFSEGETA